MNEMAAFMECCGLTQLSPASNLHGFRGAWVIESLLPAERHSVEGGESCVKPQHSTGFANLRLK